MLSLYSSGSKWWIHDSSPVTILKRNWSPSCYLTLLQSRWHTAITRLHVNMHCFRTSVEKGVKLCTAVQEGCGYKDTLSAQRYSAPSAKYFTVCITYQPPLVSSVGVRITFMSHTKAFSQCSTVVLHEPHIDSMLGPRNSAIGGRQMMACHGKNWFRIVDLQAFVTRSSKVSTGYVDNTFDKWVDVQRQFFLRELTTWASELEEPKHTQDTGLWATGVEIR